MLDKTGFSLGKLMAFLSSDSPCPSNGFLVVVVPSPGNGFLFVVVPSPSNCFLIVVVLPSFHGRIARVLSPSPSASNPSDSCSYICTITSPHGCIFGMLDF